MVEAAIMSGNVGEVLSLHELVHSWEDDPLTPEKAKSLELLVEKAVRFASDLQSIWAVCAREGSVWEKRCYLLRMQLVELLALTVVDILTRVDEIVVHTRAKHPEWSAPGAAEEVNPSLDAAREVVTRARSLMEKLNRARSPVNEEMIRRSQESLSRGEGEPVGDIISRLKNGGPLVGE